MAKSPKLKIGFVLDDSFDRLDGVQQYVLEASTELARLGHEVRFLCGETTNPPKLPGTLYSLSHNVAVKANSNRLSIPKPAPVEKIREVLAKENFDVLHVQMPYSPFMGGRVIANAKPKTKIVGTFHIAGNSPLIRFGSRLLSFIQQHTLDRFDEIICVSDAAADFFKKNFGIKDVNVVSNMVDVKSYQPEKFQNTKSQVKTILYLGRFVERKGCEFLIKALGRLKSDLPKNVKVILAGDGPLRTKLEVMVKELQLDEIVEFVGYVTEDQKRHLLQTADLAIFPATGGESFGVVLIEAMAAQRPVVLGGDNPGYRTVLTGPDEMLVDPRKIDEFAERIKQLISSRSLRQTILDWQQTTVKRYDRKRVVKQLLKFYS